MLGTLVSAGFGLGMLMGNPRRKKRRTVVDPITGRRVSVKSARVLMGGAVKRKSMRGARAMVKGADGVWRVNPRRNAPVSKVDARSMRHVLRSHGYRCNPGSIDSVGADELALTTVNDGDIYRQRIKPIIANLAKKIKKGTYDATKALKLWGYAADDGAQKYTKEYGGAGNGSFGSFNKPTRMAAAAQIAGHYDEELKEAAGVKANPQHRDVETRNYTFGLVHVEVTTWRLKSATAGIHVVARANGVTAWEAKSQGPSSGGFSKPAQAAERVYFKITGSWPPSNFGGESMYKIIAEAAATRTNPRRRRR